MNRHVRLFEEFSYLEEELHSIELMKKGGNITIFVFRDKEEADSKFQELNAKNPNLERARLTQTVNFMEKKVPSYFDEGAVEPSDIEGLYDSLSQQEKSELDEMVFKQARMLGRTLFEPIVYKIRFSQYDPIYYSVTRRKQTMGGLLEEFRLLVFSLGFEEAVKTFGNNIDWIPKDILRSMRKGLKTKNLFGI
jgi:hypothetical protein